MFLGEQAAEQDTGGANQRRHLVVVEEEGRKQGEFSLSLKYNNSVVARVCPKGNRFDPLPSLIEIDRRTDRCYIYHLHLSC